MFLNLDNVIEENDVIYFEASLKEINDKGYYF